MTVNSETKSASTPESGPEPSRGLDLSVTQIVGGALAAMTAAALGSRLSVAGTIAGAALASIIAAVAGALYTASLRRTRDKVRSVWTGAANGTPTRVEVVTEDAARAEADAAAAPPLEVSPEPVLVRPESTPEWWRSGRLWKRILVGALATFALAAGAVTGLELVSGQALSGGSGTTFEQVREPRPDTSTGDQREPSESPSEEASESPDPSTEASSEPSTTPSSEPTPEASDQPSASSSPSATESSPTDPAEQSGEATPGTDGP